MNPQTLDTADSGLFVIRIDTYSKQVITGTVDQIHLPAPMPFCSTIRLLQIIQERLQLCNVPGAECVRTVPDLFRSGSGDKATALVTVLFTQNHTWQGYLQWLDRPDKTHFRSALELLELLDCRLSA